MINISTKTIANKTILDIWNYKNGAWTNLSVDIFLRGYEMMNIV